MTPPPKVEAMRMLRGAISLLDDRSELDVSAYDRILTTTLAAFRSEYDERRANRWRTSVRQRPFADYTPHQREFLLRAYWQGVELDDPIATPRRTSKLQELGLIHKRTSKKGRASWRLTDTGRGLVATHTPRLLALRSQYGYTHQPHKAMRWEPEAV